APRHGMRSRTVGVAGRLAGAGKVADPSADVHGQAGEPLRTPDHLSSMEPAANADVAPASLVSDPGSPPERPRRPVERRENAVARVSLECSLVEADRIVGHVLDVA